MNESELSPEGGRPVDLYLDLLRIRMAPADYELLLRMVEPALKAVEDQSAGPIELSLEGAEGSTVSQEIRDEASLVLAVAVTGRLDNQIVEIETEEVGPVRIVTDADTAVDPDRRREIADFIGERHRQDEELRGIAEVSGLPTDV
ncbi:MULTISPECIES: hypothetical protein [Streptomyces]|uniref:Uncharacterized protein n=2 Tax=Streptomyces avermitilis TaxID=33903 RepID=Q82PC8_STRAW|nr:MULTISPECIES: hypothetical protein [Streptomyces]KUN54874.1 hypothetical protein AQJ43_11535 [Streptomyces avermitilis]MYS96630.1 hypothetical protein [Streptomyces sp. SID5469]OOV20892.1 hypothetical protein SM007_35825 [Streptomyces avermitilis]BAC68705.1 hypothetical protein SAVERM_995 [Streptomyces avermitilis MA-4680 = NBRC 14893]BBJ48621.1 hypothetical protein SAVMC3_12500 [Streptomyces avermitilis]